MDSASRMGYSRSAVACPVSSFGADPEVEHETVLQVVIRLRGDPGIGSPCIGSSAANRLKRNLKLGEREADSLEETGVRCFLLSQKRFLLSEYTYSTVFYPYSTRILHISQN